MKGTENFKEIIKNHLEEKAKKDEVFAEKYANKDKKLDDCITYILNTVKKSGCNGFSDDEVFGMAIHYYDEDSVDIGEKISCDVVVNHKVELTEEDKQRAKDKAIQELIEEQKAKMRKPKKTKKVNNLEQVPTLF